MLKKAFQDIHRDTIEQSKKGDAKAQYQLYSLYAKAMFNICMRMLSVREDAEDALQEAFTEVFDKLSSFRYESAFGAWVKRIVVNTCINRLNRKHPELVLSDIASAASPEEEPEMEDLELQVQQVLSAVEQLPDGYRLILNLYLFEGYDHREISEILGISESTSKTQYFKARRKVKEIIINES